MKINQKSNEKDYLRDLRNTQFVGFKDMKMRFVYGRVRGEGTVMRGWGVEQQWYKFLVLISGTGHTERLLLITYKSHWRLLN